MSLFRKKPTNTVTPPVPVIGTAGSLREFVYLDEVSVYSLVSAPDMPPPVTMSESADTTAGEALSANIEGGAPLLVKATVAGELNSSRTQGLQVQRQFNIQSQFARLHSTYQPTFLLTAKAIETRGKNEPSLQAALERLQESQHAIRASSLTRGALTELRVALRAHPVFDITVLLRVITGMVEKFPGLLQIQDDTGIRAAIEGGEFLSELMDDLVPIEGRSTTHEIVSDEQGDLWVVHLAALRSAWTGPIESQPLQVVGVTETKSFWKDTRRILHAEAEFDVLGRVSRTGLQDEWTPVKMVDTFRRVLPKATESLVTAVDDLSGFTEESQQVPDAASLLVIAGQSSMTTSRATTTSQPCPCPGRR